ncbi:MAG: AAA family ATPase [Flavobacteriales bacterium CG18_big_fil_WC_8_21_14_2_50_32_9]|nr:MAG: AAA family ATPase [Flavobacteriales bacterium CG18_big_fil_WC_8_21_14_2_50_32_9]
MEKEFYRYNPWWENTNTLLDNLLDRTESFEFILPNITNKQVVFLTGLRRVGKTSLMKLCIKYLINEKKINPLHVLYVSMDDFLFIGKSIIEIVENFKTIHKIKNEEHIYLFLDEITFVEDYELQLKNLYDKGNSKIFASSSSASLLQKQKGYLTGRSVTFEVLPLSFEMYLQFKNIVINKADGHLKETYFKDYLLTGGIPEYVLTNDVAYISELMDNIIYKDIAAVNGIRQIRQLKDYFLLLMERSGKTMSINKVAKVLGISTETSKRYFDMFCDTFIVSPVTRFGKLNEQLVSPKKIYCCDTGIRTYYTGERDWGALFENYVYLRLKHLNLSYVYENTTELDFISLNKILIECKFHNETLNEKQQLLFDNFKATEKYIIRTYNDVEFIRAKHRF